MYKDEIWHRKLVEAFGQHRDGFTGKQWAKFRMDRLLKVANRVREFSDSCETCQGFQHTLTRLEEEAQELPGSKAQRQYQAEQMWGMEVHLAAAHRLAPPAFFVRRWLRLGSLLGSAAGFVTSLVVGNLLLIPAGALVGAVLAALYGNTEDQKVEREHRRI